MPVRFATSIRWLLMCTLLALVASGCVSTKERFQKAQSYEEQARYADAVDAYVEVLEDDPGYPKARRRLLDVARQAVDERMDQARSADESGLPVRAVGLLDEIRQIHGACERVDVDLVLPGDYTSFRDAVEARAAEALLAEADEAAQARDFAAAHRLLERSRRYVDAEDRLRQLDERQAEVLLGWADQEMQQGAFLSAYRRAERVFDLVPEDHPLVDESEALRQTAVERGTRRVAFLPVWRTEQAAQSLSPIFLEDLNDVLTTRYWSAPPPFIASPDPVDLRRTMRRYGADAAILSRKDAAEVGRGVGADFVVVADLTGFAREEDDVDADRVRTAWIPDGRGETSGRRSQGDGLIDTTYVRRTFDLELTATVDYRVIDVRSSRVLRRGATTVDAEGEMRTGAFPGDWRNLDLSGSETDLFDPEVRRRREQEIENRLLDRLAGELAPEIYDDVLGEID